MKIGSVRQDRPTIRWPVLPLWQSWKSWRAWLVTAIVVPHLMACASAPPPPPTPQIVRMEISAAPDINPDARQRPSPVTVRIYLLKSVAPFDGADFLSLFSKEQAVLGSDLLQREELQIIPGERKQINLSLPKDAKHLAVMSAFRDIGHAQWRDAKPVFADSGWTVQLSGRTVQLIQSP